MISLQDITSEDRRNPTCFYEFFINEEEARLAHRLWAFALYGLNRGAQVQFPADRPPRRHPSVAPGGGLFAKVKASIRLEDFAGRFSALRPTGGGNFRGLCPLHQERHGSFYVYTEAQRWRCFGACASGGDIIDLGQALVELGKW